MSFQDTSTCIQVPPWGGSCVTGGCHSVQCHGTCSKLHTTCGSTSQVILEGMGKQGCVSLDCIHPPRGLQPGIRKRTSVNNSSQCNFEVPRRRKAEDTGSGDLLVTPEGSSRGSGGHFQSGILFPHVFSSEEDGRSKTNYRSQYPEHFPEGSNLQDGVSGNNQSLSSTGLVGLFPRPQGCLSTRTNTSSFQEVHENMLRRQGLPVPSSTVRTVPCSLVVHEDSIRGQGYGPLPRYPVTSVPGRLALQGSDSGRVSFACSSGSSSSPRTRVDCQFREVRPGSQTGVQLYWDKVQSDRLHGLLDRGQSLQTQGQTFPVEFRTDALRQPMAASHWQRGFSGETGPFRSSSYEAFPLASFSALERTEGSSRSAHSSVRRGHEGSGLVEPGRYLPCRTSGSSPTGHQDLHRCMYDRMGSSRGRDGGERHLERPREVYAHKRVRDESCSSRTTEYQPESSSPRTSFHRQHLSGSLRKSSRRHQVSVSLEGDSFAVPSSPEGRRYSKSSSHSRETERHRGYAVEGRTGSSHRVVSEPGSSSGVVPRMGGSSDRSLRDEIQSSVSGVCVSSPGFSSIRNGCSVNGLEPPVGIRLSPSTHSGQGHSEDPVIRVQSDSDSISMVSTTILSRSPGAVCSSTSSVTTASRPVNPTPIRGVSPPARAAPTPRLAAEYRTLEERGFSKEAATRISAPQAKSSLGIYEARWGVFSSWCQGRGEDPFKASTPLIADFLLYLFKDQKRRPTTITGYRTAIAGALRASQGVDYGKDPSLSALILSFFREQPKPVRSFPAWDLGLVLKVLLKAPFEPLHLADMKYVTWKTAFLVLLASGSRRGEVHSFDFKKVRHDSKWSFVTLEPHVAFVSKTQLRTVGASSFSAVRLPALGPVLDSESVEDRGLCPVRAIKIYLDRTSELREDRQLLFVSYKAGHKGDIHKNTISSWIRKLLHLAYSSAPEDVIQLSSARTHEVRALASSMAFRGSMELEEVLKACTWKSSNTFASHYLRDISSFEEDLYSLGPLVAAQSVVHPQERS